MNFLGNRGYPAGKNPGNNHQPVGSHFSGMHSMINRTLRVLGHGGDAAASDGATADDGFPLGGDDDLPQDRYQ